MSDEDKLFLGSCVGIALIAVLLYLAFWTLLLIVVWAYTVLTGVAQ